MHPHRARTLSDHTHLQQVAPVYRYTGEVPPMTLDRGTLARIDRSILAALDHEQVSQPVKVPLS